MSKRPISEVNGSADRDRDKWKRPKATLPPPPEIHNARQMRAALTFHQDAAPQLQHGILQVKFFLDSMLYSSDGDSTPRRRAILREFLISQKPKEGDEDRVYLPDLFQALVFASQTNKDNLVSDVSALLAQILKAIATDIDLREHGLGICRSVLKQDHVKLLSRSLSAPRNMKFIISPALRLLTEVVSFDGGTFARQVYARRDLTFDPQILSRNITIRDVIWKEEGNGRSRPTVRSNTVRYLLTNLKYQSGGAKADILKQYNIFRGLFDGISDDPPTLIVQIFQVLRSAVIEDSTLSPKIKGQVFNQRNLKSLHKIYRAGDPEVLEHKIEDVQSIIGDAHDFLLLVCTQENAGVLRPSTGWYPPRNNAVLQQTDDASRERRANLGLDDFDIDEEPAIQTVIPNKTLADFLQIVHPSNSMRERKLFIAIMNAAPELVAYHFQRIMNFGLDPKLTADWVAHAETLFEVIQLPVPKFFGKKDGYGDFPPPLSTVVENLLPLPVVHRALTSCINHDSHLIRLFAIRIVTLAFQKLQEILSGYRHAANGATGWDMAAAKLISEFGRRCPKMKSVVAAFRRVDRANVIEREASSRLLSLYYEVTPQVALDGKFDISLALATSLQDLDTSGPSGPEEELKLLELDHLLSIARRSPDISWWKKPETLKCSPFLTMANLACRNLHHTGEVGSSELERLLFAIMRDTGLFDMREDDWAAKVFLRPLIILQEDHSALEFVDNCLQRFIQRPIIYEDEFDNLVIGNKGGIPATRPRFSLFLMTLVEQWNYVEETKPDQAVTIATWLQHLTYFFWAIGEDANLNEVAINRLEDNTADRKIQGIVTSRVPSFSHGLNQFRDEIFTSRQREPESSTYFTETKASTPRSVAPVPMFDIATLAPPAEDEKHTALTKLSTKDVATAVEGGHLSSLILLLSSTHLSIRRQAFDALRKFAAKAQSSSYIEREQIYVLVKELLETATPFITSSVEGEAGALPYLVSAFAARCVDVLAEPTNVLYAKVNAFLNRGPNWLDRGSSADVSYLASHWCAKVLLHPPGDEAEGSHWREVVWLLSWFADGVRTPADVEILRKGSVFEKVMALFGHPSLRAYRRVEGVREGEAVGGSLQGRVRGLVLRFIARVALVDGGATTLVTRVGVMAWLENIGGSGWVDEAGVDVAAGIGVGILRRCDRERVGEWSSGVLDGEIPF